DCGSSSYSENSALATFGIVDGDFCDAPINLASMPLTDWSTIATTAGANNNITSSACSASLPGPDVIMYHDVEAGATITFVLQSPANSLSIAYGGTCPGATVLACTPGGYLSPGTYVQNGTGDWDGYPMFTWTNNSCVTERIFIVADGNTANGGPVYIAGYDHSVPTGTVCLAITGVTVNTANTGNSATVNWNASCSGNVIVEYGPTGFTPGTDASANGGTVIPVSGTTTILSGLSMDMAYDVYVRNDCGDSEYGSNGTASTFTIFNGDDCSRVIALTGETGTLGINTTGANNDISVCGAGNTGGDLVMSYIVAPDYGIYFVSTPVGPYNGQVRISYGSSCPGLTELYCAAGAADYLWLNETGVEQTVYFIQDGADEGATTVEWTYFPECAMNDTDGDGINDCDDTCINFPGQVGDPCLNGTTPGTISADCQCVTMCTGNEVVVIINTDGNAEHITWEVVDANNAVITTGGLTAGQSNMQVTETACLGSTPAVACYGFRLMDSFGDGIAGGGWELRTTGGKLLLRDEFASGSASPATPSANPSYGSAHSFCLPAGPANIAPTECGIFDNLLGNKVYANKVTGAANYQFEFSDPDAGFMRRIARPYNYVHFWDMVTNPLIPGVKYFARVRTDRDGAMAAAHFGSGCEMGLGQVVICTQLIQAPAYGHSCNETRTFNTNNSFIYAKPVQGATEYQFRIKNVNEGYDQTFIRNTYILQLKWNSNVAPPLIDGNTYSVEMNVKVNSVYSGFCASTCNITIDNGGNRPEARMAEMADNAMNLWPNPNDGQELFITMAGLDMDIHTASVDLMDITGRNVM
ncbi:MAG: fibronectin type III domain-containing protein, partial [Flavobacteriales bacterium]